MGIKEGRVRRALIKVFKPNEGELGQLDRLLFRMKLFEQRLHPHRSFFNIPRYEHWESVPKFTEQLLGPLFLGFITWPIKAFGDNQELFEFYNKDSQMTNIGALSRLRIANRNWDDDAGLLKKLIHRFDVEVEDTPKIKTKEEVSDAILVWTALLNEHTWKDVIPGKPKIDRKSTRLNSSH